MAHSRRHFVNAFKTRNKPGGPPEQALKFFEQLYRVEKNRPRTKSRNRYARRVVGTLSGGERLRSGLAATLSGSTPPWLVILDEPTNHLDIESVELLEDALRSFDGALLVESHDPSFVEGVGFDRVFEV